MSDKTKAIIAILIASLISGGASAFTKIGLIKIPPFTFSFLRFLIASIAILPIFLKSKPKINKSLVPLIFFSVLPIVNVAFFVAGVKLTTASISQMLYAATPILAGILSYFILRHKLSIKRWLFILLGLVGVIFVVALPIFEKDTLFGGDLKGNLFISFAVAVWSLYVVLSKKFQKQFSPLVITSIFIFLATLIFFFLSLTELKGNANLWQKINSSSTVAIIYVAVFVTVGGYLLNQYAIKFAGPIAASLTFYILPISGYFFAFFLLGEKITEGLVIGTMLVFISIALTTYSK
ncbi:DMT family transporter [Candidatus Roizmanbacteria bacterium]|nr:DMT family transporter [Candidatus Roizmanbacteria bacterium]